MHDFYNQSLIKKLKDSSLSEREKLLLNAHKKDSPPNTPMKKKVNINTFSPEQRELIEKAKSQHMLRMGSPLKSR